MPERVTPGVPLRFATTLRSRRLWPRRHRHVGGRAADQDRRQSAPSGEPRAQPTSSPRPTCCRSTIPIAPRPCAADRSEPWSGVRSGVAAADRAGSVAAAAPACASSPAAITSPTLDRADRRTAEVVSRRRNGIAMSRSTTMPHAAGARLAFGRPLTALPRFARGRVRAGARRRSARPRPRADPLRPRVSPAHGSRTAPDKFLRLYAVEPAWTLTGANADHRLALRPELIRNVALAIAAALGATAPQRHRAARRPRNSPMRPPPISCARRGAALVLAGPPPAARSARALPLDQQRAACAGRPHRAGRSGDAGHGDSLRSARRRHARRQCRNADHARRTILSTTRPASSASARRSPPCRSALISASTGDETARVQLASAALACAGKLVGPRAPSTARRASCSR